MRHRDAQTLQLCEGLHAVARRTWGRRFLGRPPGGSTLAAGTEVTGHRDYVTGDDVRYVDWNRAARLDELVSKQFAGGAPQRVDVLLDTSASMGLGYPSKLALGKELASALGYLALADECSVRLSSFGRSSAVPSRWHRGRTAAPAWLREVARQGRASGQGGLAAAVRCLVEDRAGGNLIVVLSDLLDPAGFEPGLDLLRKTGRDLYVVQVFAADDAEPKWAGPTRLHDVETGEDVSADLDDDDLKHYREAFADLMHAVERYCRRYGAGVSQFRSDQNSRACLARMLNTVSLTAGGT